MNQEIKSSILTFLANKLDSIPLRQVATHLNEDDHGKVLFFLEELQGEKPSLLSVMPLQNNAYAVAITSAGRKFVYGEKQ